MSCGTRAKLGWRMGIGTDILDLDLPGGRSLVHRLDPVHAGLSYDEIEAVETRLEAYPSFGMVNMHRAYALKLKSGDLIILGEDRALNTGMASAAVSNAVLEILRRRALEVRDLGMAKGRGGLLCVSCLRRRRRGMRPALMMTGKSLCGARLE